MIRIESFANDKVSMRPNFRLENNWRFHARQSLFHPLVISVRTLTTFIMSEFCLSLTCEVPNKETMARSKVIVFAVLVLLYLPGFEWLSNTFQAFYYSSITTKKTPMSPSWCKMSLSMQILSFSRDGIRVSGKLGQVQLTFFVKCSYAELIEGNMKLFVRLAKSLLLDISNATTASSFVSICNPSHCWCGRGGTWRYFWKIRLICLFLNESLVKRQVLIFYLKKHINLKMMQ